MKVAWFVLLCIVGTAFGWRGGPGGPGGSGWPGWRPGPRPVGGGGIKPPNPHIMIIMADDLGYGDVGYNKGSDEVITPNIDAIALNGITFDRLYGGPMCTPSRASFMTGKYACRTGLQSLVLFAAERRGLPLEYKLLPQYLRELGYKTHLLGKWHLGHCNRDYTPLYRGYENHTGYWTGHQDYYNHYAEERDPADTYPGVTWLGYDMRRQEEVAWDLEGKYTTHIITEEAERIIAEHDPSKSLFLHLSHLAPHAGNSQDPLQAPNETVAKFAFIADPKRQRFAAMMSELDKSVGKTITALKNKGMLHDTIILFLSDNGGTRQPNENSVGSNWPLRGEKTTLYEGGVRLVGSVWTSWLKNRGTKIEDLIHMVDWLPTLVRAAGGDPASIEGTDGMNHWDNLMAGQPLQRSEVLVNIDQLLNLSSVIKGKYKLVAGGSFLQTQEEHYGIQPKNPAFYQPYSVLNSSANMAFEEVTGYKLTEEQINTQRERNQVRCNYEYKQVTCIPSKPCVFNLEDDPCENNDRYYDEPMKVAELQKALAEYHKIAIPPSNMVWDIQGNPMYWDNTWTDFCDYTSPPTTTTSATTATSPS